MRTIGVVTVARSDFGIYQSFLKDAKRSSKAKLQIIATGMHFEKKFGNTFQEIEQAGFTIEHRIPLRYTGDSPGDIACVISDGVAKFADLFSRCKFDILVVLGDRFEMLAATLAALPFKIPIAHLHGGESTEGLIDEAIRHSITKMSHIHFASTEVYRNRIIKMGENPDRVFNAGAVSLDDVENVASMDKIELEKDLNIKLDEKCLLATFHPVTLEFENTRQEGRNWLSAITESGLQTIITYPNSDTSGSIIIEEIEKEALLNRKIKVVQNLGKRRYFSLMKYCSAMIGNSSSGIIEAASFNLPVVNIGNRQLGRIHAHNVLDVGISQTEILAGIRKVTSDSFKKSLENLKNPYVNGRASEKIMTVLENIPVGLQLIEKNFYDSK